MAPPYPGAAGSDDLVTSYLPLVDQLAHSLAFRLPRHLEVDDLIGAGCLALVQAARTFDPDYHVPFERFACVRIRGAMIDHMRERDWASRTTRSNERAVAATTESLTHHLQRTPTSAEVASASGMSGEQLSAVRAGSQRAAILSLDATSPHTDSSHVASPETDLPPDETLLAAERNGYIRDALAELPARTRHIVAGYYLNNRSLTDLAHELGITASRASQLRAQGLELLRDVLTQLLEPPSAETGDESSTQQVDAMHPATAETTGEPVSQGTKAKRRRAYRMAVARRSSVRDRADVDAYLRGLLNPAETSPAVSAETAGAPVANVAAAIPRQRGAPAAQGPPGAVPQPPATPEPRPHAVAHS